MAPDLDGDLGVDVLIIGGGIQGLYIAREVAKSYSVCVVSDPAVGAATLESSGYFSAGYDGNDANRIQPARRAAGWWRLWAESNQVPFAEDPPYFVVSQGDVSTRTRLWTDAMLAVSAVDELPDAFADGSLEGDAVFRAETDVVIDPATVLTRLRDGLESRCIEGEIVRFGLVADDAIDHVQVQVGDQAVPIVPRFVVLAAGVGNATLLSKLGSRFSDQARRKSSKELVESSQAVQSQYLLCVRGRDLPDLSGRFGSLTIASHGLTDSAERVWLVAPPVDDELTTLGPDNLRFERPIDSAVVADTVDRLFQASPALAKQASDLQFAVYVARRTQHPMVAVADASLVAQPAPAKLEKFGLECFLAVWPSHLAYAQFVGDSVAERIADALGPALDFSDGPQPADLGVRPTELRSRWDRADFPWASWSSFAAAHGLADP
jgi:glycine/D-amino acid oxidase-like deaminating enzyme